MPIPTNASNCKVNYEATRCGKCHEGYLTDRPAWSTSQCPRCGFVEKRRTAAESTFGDFGDSRDCITLACLSSFKAGSV